MSYKIIQGDCLEVMRTMPDKSVDLVLTDPPYGTTACDWDTVQDLVRMWQNLERIGNNRCSYVLTASQPFTTDLIQSNREWFKYEWIWDKGVSGSFANAKYQPLKTHESVIVFCKKSTRYYPRMTNRYTPARIGGVRSGSTQGCRKIVFNESKLSEKKIYTDAFPKSVLYISPRADESRGLHPTQKPVALMEYLIATYTQEGDTVLDPFCGSGTTGVAAVAMGRNFIGIEIDPKYCAMAEKRIRNECGLLIGAKP